MPSYLRDANSDSLGNSWTCSVSFTRFERAYERTQKYTGCCARGRLSILGVLQLVWDLPWVPLLRWTWNFVIEDL